MSESDKPLRQQIDDGMEAIRHQLERLREGPTWAARPTTSPSSRTLNGVPGAQKARTGLVPHDRAPNEFDGETPD